MKNIKQFTATIELLRSQGLEDMAKNLESQIQVFQAKDLEVKAKKAGPFSPDQVEVVAFRTKEGKIEHVIGVGYKKLSPAMWRKYLSNADTIAKILELANSDLSSVLPKDDNQVA